MGQRGLRVIVPHPIGEPGAIVLKTSDAKLYNLILQMVYFLNDATLDASPQSGADDLTDEERLALARECLEEARQLLREANQDGTRRMLEAVIEELCHAAAAA